MGFDGLIHAFWMMSQVFLLDLVLSGDNAVVIALACRALPPPGKRKVILLGTVAAIVLRVLLTTVIAFLLGVPSLRIVGGLMLIAIALKLILEEDDATQEDGVPAAPDAAAKFWTTVGMVVIADTVMSIDNVVALAAVAQGSIFILVLGLLCSVPLLMYGSLLVTRLLDRHPWLLPGVGALLGWVGGDVGISDPLIANWVNTQSPALALVVPPLCAAYVLLQSRILLRARPARQTALTTSAVVAPPRTRFAAVAGPAARPLQTSTGISNASAAGPAYGPRAARQPLPAWLRSSLIAWLAGAAAVVVPVLLFVRYSGIDFMPAPDRPTRYDCPGLRGTFSIYYKHGGDRVQLRSEGNTLDGDVRYSRIEWPRDGAARLGFAPPEEIVAYDAGAIRIDGGNFSHLRCVPAP